jgi:hypothetical protein
MASTKALDANEVHPTPTQVENDRRAMGIDDGLTKEWDGSPIEQQSHDPTPPPGGPGVGTAPSIGTWSPNAGPLPDVDLVINGSDFTDKSLIVFNGVPQATTHPLPTELRASVTGFPGPVGVYKIIVRDDAGDSDPVSFTFVDPVFRRTKRSVDDDRSTRRGQKGLRGPEGADRQDQSDLGGEVEQG